MARPKLISDDGVLDAALVLFAHEGDRGVSFGMVAKATGLAPATLVQRFVSREALYSSMILRGWSAVMQIFARCEADMLPNGQNGVAFLKALRLGLETAPAPPIGPLLMASFANPALRVLASDFRRAVEGSLEHRIERGPSQAAEFAAALFAAWQGRMLWKGTEGGDFRLRSIVKKS
jgi:AcrR family transcriptional regulator